MRFFAGAIALLVGTAVAQDGCNCNCQLDDCLQALLGVSPFLAEPTVADCRANVWIVSTVSSERVITTEIATATSTNTVVETSFTTITVSTQSAPLQKRQEQSTIPAYASACTDYAHYTSACGCIGIKEGGTSYFHRPGIETVTYTTTVSATQDLPTTTTATVSAVETQLHFKIRVADVAENDEAQNFKGWYMYTVDETSNGVTSKRVAFVNNANQGVIFRAGSDGKVLGGDGTPFAADRTDARAEQVYLQQPIAQQILVEHNFDSGSKVVSGRLEANAGTFSLLAIGSNARMWLYVSKQAIDDDKPSLGTVGPVILEAVTI
ncbi:hypothetical protein TWF506_003203 [Arthrobotrys conoides]|uniref:Uncharacterized protein n=1 Tax=Arthrobotrys conoides TaxID=74498 RepID=A0AAN8NMZ3_9PEZI